MILSLSIYAGVFRAAYYGHELRPYNFSIYILRYFTLH